MRVVFMGTPEFSVPSLLECINKYEVVGVFTQPDKPRGRGKKVTFSPIKEVALENGVNVYQPEKLKTEENYKILKELNPDVIVVVAYGQILSKDILSLPKYGCINVHASLLPQYRGASPIQWAIVKGEKKSGVTTMLMDEGLDTGDILLKSEIDITDDMTAGELHNILKVEGSKLLAKTLDNIENIKRIKQGFSESYAPMLNKSMGQIDFSKSAYEILRLINGFNPWPVAFSHLDGKIIKVYKAEVTDIKSNGELGSIYEINKEGIFVNTSDFLIKFVEIQFPNKKRMKVSQYILGHKIDKNLKFT